MVYTNDRAADVHSSKGRRRKRSRRLRWPLKLFCMCLVLSAVVLTIRTVRSFSAPMSALEPAEQLTEQHPESSLQEPDALPPVELNPAPQSGAVTPDDWQILLVNRWNPLPDGYTFERTKLKYGHSVDSRAYPDLQEMMDDCRAAGLDPVICSSYRTQAKQQELYENKLQRLIEEGYSYENAVTEAGTVVAVPGTSEHQTGLALDIVDASYQILDQGQEDTLVQQWLIEHSWEYGFVLRYPNAKSEITGIIYEPWHYRYVGQAIAQTCMDQGLTYEEYLAAQVQPGENQAPALFWQGQALDLGDKVTRLSGVTYVDAAVLAAALGWTGETGEDGVLLTAGIRSSCPWAAGPCWTG